MKLISFEHQGISGFGIVDGDGVIDAGVRMPHCQGSLARALVDSPALQQWSRLPADFAMSEVNLLPVIPDSRRIVCVGLNYKTHIAEIGRGAPQFPMLFPRYPDSLVAHGAALVRPAVSEQFDFEGELAFVIGQPGHRIDASRALDHVAGYACFNDGSVRDYQRHTSQFMPGKNFTASGSFGPWLVTPDEFGEVGSQTLETRLNGQTMQSARLDDMLFGVADLIAYVSTIWTIQPGDVIATGTPGGVGLFREPPLWMKPGDLVEVTISGLGTLSNRVAQDTAVSASAQHA